MEDETFQAHCQRYAHANGSSDAIARAAISAAAATIAAAAIAWEPIASVPRGDIEIIGMDANGAIRALRRVGEGWIVLDTCNDFIPLMWMRMGNRQRAIDAIFEATLRKQVAS
jgi:hypothetical protein